MATYDQFLISDFHKRTFEKAHGSPSGRTRVNVKEGSPSSPMKCRNDAGNRVEGGRMDKELERIERSAKRVQAHQPQYVKRNADGTLTAIGPKAPKRKRQYFHQTEVKVNSYTFATGSSLDGALWTCTATSEAEAKRMFKKHFYLDRLPARSLMFINGKAVQ